MGIKIWLDDVREMPRDFDIHCKTAIEAWQLIRYTKDVDYISFDNDLGEKALDGYWLAVQIESWAQEGKIPRISWGVHTDNPAGRKNIIAAMISAERFWDEQEGKQ